MMVGRLVSFWDRLSSGAMNIFPPRCSTSCVALGEEEMKVGCFLAIFNWLVSIGSSEEEKINSKFSIANTHPPIIVGSEEWFPPIVVAFQGQPFPTSNMILGERGLGTMKNSWRNYMKLAQWSRVFLKFMDTVFVIIMMPINKQRTISTWHHF